MSIRLEGWQLSDSVLLPDFLKLEPERAIAFDQAIEQSGSVPTNDETSALQQAEERAAIAQEPRKRTPAQRAVVAAFNARAARTRAAGRRRKSE